MSLTLFQNVRLFDGESPEVRDGMSVLVEGNEIREVSARPIKAAAAENCAR